MLTYGADPEYACVSSERNGTYIIPPAALIEDHNLEFTVNENNKRVLYTCDEYGSVIEDGAAVELNIKPQTELAEVRRCIQSLLGQFNTYLRTKKLSYTMSKIPIGYFDVNKYWKGRGPEFLDCVRFGCDPDFFPEYYKEIGLEKENPHEVDVSKHTQRYFGGHIHVGSDTKFDTVYSPIVFDFTVGLMNAALFRSMNQRVDELERLKFYGHPGRGRIQKWGYEYRPPSNHWTYCGDNASAKLESAIVFAETIVRLGLHQEFFFYVREHIPAMWDACVTLNQSKAKNLYLSVTFPFLADHGLVKLSMVKNVINLDYL